mmetsp:Transcript_16220/g.43998  ORF Transcript_16220/g.43998 Transcript_16220/m.43998 type:complete len:104 (+) Transcript_16220:1028-1339(+)
MFFEAAGLYLLSERLGFPPRFCKLAEFFHIYLTVKVAIGDADVSVTSTTGFKQGRTPAPIWFSVYIQTVEKGLDARLNKARLCSGRQSKSKLKNLLDLCFQTP